jgi:hypothetical protein
MRTYKRYEGADGLSARVSAAAAWIAWGCLALVLAGGGVWAAEAPPPRLEGGDPADSVLWAPRPKPMDRTRKAAVAQRMARQERPSDELGLLGDLKALDVRDDQALFRVDGQEQTLRPGDSLKGDVVKSITPKRMVLLRSEAQNEKMGETLIIIDFLAPGRTRVRMYAARDWTARPFKSVE